MQTLLRALGVVTALVLLVISAGINARFGYGLGRTPLDGTIYAAASVATDGFKVASVFFMAWAFAARQPLSAAASLVLFVLCTGYSLTSAVGFAAVNRSEMTETRAIPQREHASLMRQLTDERNLIASLGTARASEELEAAIQGHKRNVRWQTTAGCSDVTLPASRTYCAEYDALVGELARSQKLSDGRKRIKDLEARLASVADQGLSPSVDPQAQLLAQLLGAPMTNVQLGLSLLMAGLVEFGSAVGLFVAMQSGTARSAEGRAPARKPNIGSPSQFAVHVVVRRDGAELLFEELAGAYAAWCHQRGLEALNEDDARRELLNLLQAAGVPTATRGGEVRLLGVKIESG